MSDSKREKGIAKVEGIWADIMKDIARGVCCGRCEYWDKVDDKECEQGWMGKCRIRGNGYEFANRTNRCEHFKKL